MEPYKFTTVKDLYIKVEPALNTKVADLRRNNIHHITEENIWNYLKKHYWTKSNSLTLGEIVNDILSTPNEELEGYMKKLQNKKN